jgi:signal transduction histidine kinase
MRLKRPASWRWPLAWLLLAMLGGLLLVRGDIATRRDAFQTDARIAHRLLSQRAVQQDAILATLLTLHPPPASLPPLAQQLAALYPQLLALDMRPAAQPWPSAALQGAEHRSRASGHAEVVTLTAADAAPSQYTLLQAGDPTSLALRIDVQRMVPWDEWPIERAGPVRVSLVHDAVEFVIQPGEIGTARPFGLTAGFVFAKTLASPAQPFELRLQQATGPAQWPWRWLLAWAGLVAAALAGLSAWQRARRARWHAEERLRIGQVARLNTLGELAAGMAHELNQPLTALIANTQAARRLLDDEPPELEPARQAMAQAVAQGRRAADVVARLRRQVEAPGATAPSTALHLADVAGKALLMFEPELRARSVRASWHGQAPAVQADPVALEQIVHNLVSNALQAMEAVPAPERALLLQIGTESGRGVLLVRDTGPGLAADTLPRVFEPFFTTRPGGLGLGLSLCESLAQSMHGTLTVRNVAPHGAEFRLELPLAKESTA